MCMDQSVRNDLNLLLLAGFECERLATRDPLQTWCAAVSVASRYVELRPVWSTLASLSRACRLSYHADGRPYALPWCTPVGRSSGPRLCGQYGRWDGSRRCASFSGRYAGPVHHAAVPLRKVSCAEQRSMTSWRADVGRPFVFHAGRVTGPVRLRVYCRFAHSFSVAVARIASCVSTLSIS